MRDGDTLSGIAEEWFGDANKWDLIARANPGIDPDRLRIGQTLRLPPRDAASAAPGASRNTGGHYTVRSGDSLSSIARELYGDETLWKIIYDANREVIGDDPDRIKVGMTLTIPPKP